MSVTISGQEKEPHIWRRSRHRGRGQTIENGATEFPKGSRGGSVTGSNRVGGAL